MTGRKQTGGGPGRGTPQTRAAARRRARATQNPSHDRRGRGLTASVKSAESGAGSARHGRDARAATAPGRLVQGLSITRRAAVMIVVAAILLVSYATSLRIYFSQQHDMALTRQEIARRQASVDQLSDEVNRWDDPTFVRAQARDRLGWVMPGETGYRVLAPDGTLLGGGAGIQSEATKPADEHDKQWWDKLVGSIQVADQPAPAPTPKPTPRIITLEPTPSAKPAR